MTVKAKPRRKTTSRGKAVDSDRFSGVSVAARPAAPLGPWTQAFDGWVAREVAPRLYEAMREAMGPIDGAINRLVMLDGIIRVQGDNDKIVAEIEDWMGGVPVNDMEAGYQAFYSVCGNEMYEQGFYVGEYFMSKSGRDVDRLRVADSKGIYFRRAEEFETWYMPPAPDRMFRRDGTEQMERVLRNTWMQGELINVLQAVGYRKLDPTRILYAAFHPEADSPYGTSIMRSTEFDVRVLLVIKNALYRVWERFGDPIFRVIYKPAAKLTEEQLAARRTKIATDLAAAMNVKRQGNSADVVQAIGKNDELDITVLGADGQTLEIEAPARHLLENVVAKTGLPSWMLGFHWSTAERLAERQGEIALQESKTRFEKRRPGLMRPIEAMLRARGRTWKSGDWELYQELPNLQDLVAQAQAGFLNAQTELMRSGAGLPVGQQVQVNRDGKVLVPGDEGYYQPLPVYLHGNKGAGHGHVHKGEAYVEDAAALMRLEREATAGLLGEWDACYEELIRILGVGGKQAKAAKDGPSFAFDAALMLNDLLELERLFVDKVGSENPALAASMYQAWVRGVVNGSDELGVDEITNDARELVRQELLARGLAQARDVSTRALREDIIATLAEGGYDGLSPRDVARELRKRFDIHNADWERLARSEIAAAQGRGKLDQYAAHGIEEYDWIDAGGACPICTRLAQGGPYKVGSPGSPMPMTDSHPNCRCTVAAR